VKATLWRRIGARSNWLNNLRAEVGLNQRLSDYGVKAAQLETLADQAIQDGCHHTNPVPVTRQDLLTLYRTVL